MPKQLLTIKQVLTLLPETPARITTFTAGLTPAQLRASPSEGEWSANGLLAHLRACADIWGNCIARILAEDKPTLRAVNPRTWIHQTDYLEQEFPPALRAFTAQRAALLVVLESLSPNDWARTATVTGAGRPLERTVLFYAQWLARHERSHRKQLERTVNAVRR